MVWDGLADERAADLWQRAYALLQARAARIPDEKNQKLFLEQVSINRAILEIMAGIEAASSE